eukprot:360685-Chlamydomonas_euryale.AAC.5
MGAGLRRCRSGPTERYMFRPAPNSPQRGGGACPVAHPFRLSVCLTFRDLPALLISFSPSQLHLPMSILLAALTTAASHVLHSPQPRTLALPALPIHFDHSTCRPDHGCLAHSACARGAGRRLPKAASLEAHAHTAGRPTARSGAVR